VSEGVALAGLPICFFKQDFEIRAFLTHGFFGNKKNRQNVTFFQLERLAWENIA